MLNTEVFQNIQNAQKKILIVTKYWDEEKTLKIMEEAWILFPEEFYGLWENRIETIKEKNIPREHIHFIGNIQSRKIPEIIQYCSTLHSLSSLKHAQKIEEIGLSTRVFIQIKLDQHKDIWIWEWELWEFLEACSTFKNLKIVGISGMGSWEYSEQDKRNEFQKLISLRDAFLPNGYISAGTSRDYDIALEEWIDIVRIWTASII